MHGDGGPGTMRKDTVHCWRPRDAGGLELNGRETWVGGQLGKSQGVGLAHAGYGCSSEKRLSKNFWFGPALVYLLGVRAHSKRLFTSPGVL